MRSMPRKTFPRLRSVRIKGKEFHQVSVPQPGGGRRLRTFKNPDEAKRFYAAVQDETSRLALYRLEEEARRYVNGEAPKRTKPQNDKHPLTLLHPMTTKLVALFILSSALVVFSRDQLPAATYPWSWTNHGHRGGGYDKSADPRQTGDQGPYRFY